MQGRSPFQATSNACNAWPGSRALPACLKDPRLRASLIPPEPFEGAATFDGRKPAPLLLVGFDLPLLAPVTRSLLPPHPSTRLELSQAPRLSLIVHTCRLTLVPGQGCFDPHKVKTYTRCTFGALILVRSEPQPVTSVALASLAKRKPKAGWQRLTP
jgi:hypothetical protein